MLGWSRAAEQWKCGNGRYIDWRWSLTSRRAERQG